MSLSCRNCSCSLRTHAVPSVHWKVCHAMYLLRCIQRRRPRRHSSHPRTHAKRRSQATKADGTPEYMARVVVNTSGHQAGLHRLPFPHVHPRSVLLVNVCPVFFSREQNVVTRASSWVFFANQSMYVVMHQQHHGSRSTSAHCRTACNFFREETNICVARHTDTFKRSSVQVSFTALATAMA